MSENEKTDLNPAASAETPPLAVPAGASTELPTVQEITNVLMAVEDPELHINIVDLGLVYKIDREPEAGRIHVDMTLTTPACPYGPQLLAQTHTVLQRLPNVKDVHVNTVWSPRWDPRVHASEVAQMMLGLI
jgi:metal-sulfur cluster biosynthetic enzyme